MNWDKELHTAFMGGRGPVCRHFSFAAFSREREARVAARPRGVPDLGVRCDHQGGDEYWCAECADGRPMHGGPDAYDEWVAAGKPRTGDAQTGGR